MSWIYGSHHGGFYPAGTFLAPPCSHAGSDGEPLRPIIEEEGEGEYHEEEDEEGVAFERLCRENPIGGRRDIQEDEEEDGEEQEEAEGHEVRQGASEEEGHQRPRLRRRGGNTGSRTIRIGTGVVNVLRAEQGICLTDNETQVKSDCFQKYPLSTAFLARGEGGKA